MFHQFVEKNHSVQNGIFVEILPDGGALINKSDNSGYPQKTYWSRTGPFLPLIWISKLVCFVLGVSLNYFSDCIMMDYCK